MTLSPLSKNASSFRGVLTGLTEAFLIDEDTKNELIEKDRNSEILIKPFLQGRQIKPYVTAEPTTYLIKIEKGLTNSSKGELEPEEWLSLNYPAIYEHLKKYEEKAKLRGDKGDYWWELRACDYYSEFYKSKLMYQVMQVKPCFIFDETGLFCNNSMWIIPSDNKVLLSILNSKMGWWLISKYCTAIQNGYQLIWDYFGKIPIPQIPETAQEPFVEKVDEILALKKANPAADTSILEAEIDRMVYDLYELTEEEIAIVEGK